MYYLAVDAKRSAQLRQRVFEKTVKCLKDKHTPSKQASAQGRPRISKDVQVYHWEGRVLAVGRRRYTECDPLAIFLDIFFYLFCAAFY